MIRNFPSKCIGTDQAAPHSPPLISAATPDNKISAAGWTYDRGNVTSIPMAAGTRQFTYDGENRQLTATINGTQVGTYTYDGEGHRVKAVTTGANAGTTIN